MIEGGKGESRKVIENTSATEAMRCHCGAEIPSGGFKHECPLAPEPLVTLAELVRRQKT